MEIRDTDESRQHYDRNLPINEMATSEPEGRTLRARLVHKVMDSTDTMR